MKKYFAITEQKFGITKQKQRYAWHNHKIRGFRQGITNNNGVSAMLWRAITKKEKNGLFEVFHSKKHFSQQKISEKVLFRSKFTDFYRLYFIDL